MGEIVLSSGQSGRQARDLAKKLRSAGRTDLRRNLRKTIADAGRPVLDEVKAAVRELRVTSKSDDRRHFTHADSSHGGGTGQRRAHNVSKARATAKASLEKARERAGRRRAGLRGSVAAATKLQITAKGVRFVVSSAQLPESQKSLPRHLDSAKGWRHPVFGNREVWVAERGGPWFAETLKKRAPEFRAAVVDAMEQTRAELEK